MATEAGTVEVVMPAMGDSVAEGTVLEWRKKEGDPVAADETIVEISTDKVDAEIPAPVGGRLAKILAAEGETIAVGAPLAEIATGDGNGARPEAGEPDEARPEAPEPQATPSGQAENGGAPVATAAAADLEPSAESRPPAHEAKTVDIVTPTGGESVTEGTILEWTAKVGESVKQGDTVVVVSTDKVDMELPAPGSGTVSEVLAEEGASVTVGQVVGRMTIETSGERAPASRGDGHAPAANEAAPPAAPAGREAAPASTEAPPAPTEAAPAPTEAPPEPHNVSPIARRIAAQQGIDLSRVEGSARGGRITKADVLAAAGDGRGAGTTSPSGTAPGAKPL